MSEIVEKVAAAMGLDPKNHFARGQACAAIKATLEHLRDNVSDKTMSSLPPDQIIKIFLSQALTELES